LRGAVYKRHPKSEGRGLSIVRTFLILRTRREASDSNIHRFCCKIFQDFSKIMVCPHGQGGLRQCGYFQTKKRGQIFVILLGRLLRTLRYMAVTRRYLVRGRLLFRRISSNCLFDFKTNKSSA